jgi:hypothetical protein
MRVCVAWVSIALLAGCAGMQEKLPPPPAPAEVVALARAGESADAIIERMRASRAVYPLPASELARLREEGVPDRVIDYMQQTHIDAVRQAEWQRLQAHYHFFYGAPYPRFAPYPHPYDWRWRRFYW